jgi:hypothetical protein
MLANFNPEDINALWPFPAMLKASVSMNAGRLFRYSTVMSWSHRNRFFPMGDRLTSFMLVRLVKLSAIL